MPNKTKIILEPAAQKFADDNAKPPFLPALGPEKGRETVDSVQSSDIYKPEVDIEDLMVPGGPNGDVSIRIVRPLAPHQHRCLLSCTFMAQDGCLGMPIPMIA